MPNKSRRGRKRGRKQKAETKLEPEKIPPQTQEKRGRKRGRKRKTDPIPPQVVDSSTSTTPAPVPSTSDDYEYKYSSVLPYLTVTASSGENMFSRDYVKPTACLSDCLFAEDEKSDIEIETTESEPVDIRCSENVSTDLLSLNTTTSFEESIDNCVKLTSIAREETSDKMETMSQKEDHKEEAGEGTSKNVATSSPVKNENPPKKPRMARRLKLPVPPCVPLTESEEAARMRDLERRITEGGDLSIADIRLYRKMKMQPVKKEREKTRAVFDPHLHYHSFWTMIHTNSRFPLDRYLYDTFLYSQFDYLNSFRTRILDSKEQYFCILSPYSKRILPPFIFRDYYTTPLWLRMMDELQRKANKKNPTWKPPPRGSIDYCYVQPHHLPAMNSLAELYFWPGINLEHCLRCPDFSCAVFYKKLLIGFTIAQPNVFRNDIYIAFMVVRKEWQCSGIGNIMLYHVIESSQGRTMTLHVSPLNPALILYQRFGFRVICFEKNFYLRYLPPGSNKCKHAVHMRSDRFLKK